MHGSDYVLIKFFVKTICLIKKKRKEENEFMTVQHQKQYRKMWMPCQLIV